VLDERLSAAETLAARTSRRGFLARAGAFVIALAGGGLAAAFAPDEADAFHFCGHIYTTGSCPHPTGLPRVDGLGFPLRARDGKPVDDLGRVVDAAGHPVDEHGNLLRDPDGNPLPSVPRTRVCEGAGKRYGFHGQIDGAWYRCCGGHVRKLIDCCGYTSTRINGDGALTGYCYKGRRVYCVMYFQTKVKC
jgi:hypothetical protein